MFAKLKEKIQKEGGTVAEKERGLPVLPGHASPRRISLSNTSSPLSKDSPAPLDITSSIEELEDKTDYDSKEEAIVALQNRTDQCKRLVTRLQEYASVIKDNNLKIEKLENFIEKQQETTAKRTQELNEQHQSSRTKLSDNYKVEMEKKNQELTDLQTKSKQLEEGFASDSAKKLQYQDVEVGRLQKEVESLSGQLKDLQTSHTDLTTEITSLQEKLKKSEVERCKLEEENIGHSKMVTSLTKERMSLEDTLKEVREQLSQKSGAFCSLESKHSELESNYQALVHNTDAQKHKSKQQIEEQGDQIEQLTERIKLLEQREQNETLSGDERSLALEKEREVLERKLTETREQLSQVKTSWSDKISHLEGQISHLNTKISEDSEEIKEAHRQTDTVKQELNIQIGQLKEKLAETEKKCLETADQANMKVRQCDKEKLELETEVSRLKLDKTESEVETCSTLGALRSQISQLDSSQEQLKAQVEQKTHELQTAKSSYEECKQEVLDKDLELSDQRVQIQTLRDELHMSKETVQMLEDASHESVSELNVSNKDKDELMLRNVELSQQVTSFQTSTQELRRDTQRLESELATKVESEAHLQNECHLLQERVQQLSETVSHTTHSTEEVTRLEQLVVSLEEQLVDKNKASKKMEQRLSELKKTLQRELKVQALPNDEQIDPKLVALTPPMPRKNQVSRPGHGAEHGNLSRKLSRESSPFPNNDSVQDNGVPTQGSYGIEDFFVGQGHRNSHHMTSNSHATLQLNIQQTPGAFSANSFSVSSQSAGHIARGHEFDTRHLEKDINFQYLKHVVMKFMLSREHEAIHLIKAVSLLLRFTPEEQKLIKDTLQWKMSWFGGSQPPAVVKGLSSKIIPPSY